MGDKPAIPTIEEIVISNLNCEKCKIGFYDRIRTYNEDFKNSLVNSDSLAFAWAAPDYSGGTAALMRWYVNAAGVGGI